MKNDKKLEDSLAKKIAMAGLPEPTREVMVIPGRKFRFDFAWLEHKLLVEVQGATWIPGRAHSSGAGIERDCEKLNLAGINGYTLFQFTSTQISKGKAIIWLQQFFNNHPME